MSRIFAIPDIHGRADLLKNLTDKLYFEEELDLEKDKVIFLGDYIGRGPDSCQVIYHIREMTRSHPENVIALAGNHEWIAINACNQPSEDNRYLWLMNGGGPTIRSFDCDDGWIPKSDLLWMGSLPLSYETDEFFFSHAPIPVEEHRLKRHHGQPYTKEEMIWTYLGGDSAQWAKAPNGKIGVCGHIHNLPRSMEPRFYDHYIYADAGCGCSPDAPLVAIDVKTRDVIYAHPEKKNDQTHLK